MRNFRFTQLANGLRVVTEQISHVESAALGIWVAGGLEIEPDRTLGISHYLEHMLFKGTKRHNARQISEEIDSIGGHLNGYTDREYVCLYVQLLGEYLPRAVDILFDMALESKMTPLDIEREREVIIQESRRLEDSPEEYIHDLAVEVAWQNHPLGRSIHGTEESINAITRRDLLAYYKSIYRPNRMLVAAAGAVNHDQLVEMVARVTEGLPQGEVRESLPAPQFFSEEKRLNRSTEQVHLCIVMPGYAQADEKRYAYALFDTILGDSTSSRLFQEIREKRGLAYSIGSYSLSSRNGGLFFINVGTSKENLAQVMGLIQKELDKFHKKGPTEKELAWAKAYVKGSLALARESTSFRMQRIANSMLYEGRVLSHQKLIDKFEKLTIEELRDTAERIFSARPTIVAMGPVEEK